MARLLCKNGEENIHITRISQISVGELNQLSAQEQGLKCGR